jgi:hypothetical protein
MISDIIYLISLFALGFNRNPTKITRINYLSIRDVHGGTAAAATPAAPRPRKVFEKFIPAAAR